MPATGTFPKVRLPSPGPRARTRTQTRTFHWTRPQRRFLRGRPVSSCPSPPPSHRWCVKQARAAAPLPSRMTANAQLAQSRVIPSTGRMKTSFLASHRQPSKLSVLNVTSSPGGLAFRPEAPCAISTWRLLAPMEWSRRSAVDSIVTQALWSAVFAQWVRSVPGRAVDGKANKG